MTAVKQVDIEAIFISAAGHPIPPPKAYIHISSLDRPPKPIAGNLKQK